MELLSVCALLGAEQSWISSSQLFSTNEVLSLEVVL